MFSFETFSFSSNLFDSALHGNLTNSRTLLAVQPTQRRVLVDALARCNQTDVHFFSWGRGYGQKKAVTKGEGVHGCTKTLFVQII